MTHRQAATVLRLPDHPNTSVTIKQSKHKFLFGCAEFSVLPYVSGEMKPDTAAAAEKRYSHMAEIFNQVTLPFYWGRYEPKRGEPDFARTQKAAKWLAQRGITLKGHPLCWHTVCADWLMDLTNDEIYDTQMARVTRDIVAFRGLIDAWDVINEAVIMPIFDKYDNGVTRICKEHGRFKLIKDLFKTAREANPNATLLINDFDMSESYDILVEGLLEAGVKIDAIGLQSHMHQGCWPKEKLLEVLDRFSRFKLPLHFTEISLVSGEIMPKEIMDLNDHKVDKWPSTPEGEARQAREIKWFYETLYAHPLVEAVTYWSFMDGLWLNAPSGLLSLSSDPKPAYDVLRRLIKEDWWTPEQKLTTDENGKVSVTGTKGEYIAYRGDDEIRFTIG
ncbi:MAG: endo-1,4-beta-xylanase [Defluviitaleaceae bacterium]|nr:endo-1,4-beta-xylanase [Defluviitaleaceae bacterium]